MLRGHIALITGAGSGIGQATCQLFAEEGATVVAADINQESASKTIQCLSGENHLSLQIDVRDRCEIEDGINQIKSKYLSPPTIAVNSAGVFSSGSFLDISDEAFNMVMDINVKGVLLTTQTICRELIMAGKSGTVVNLASRAVVTCKPHVALYSMSKAAVDVFTKSTAKEMAKYNIRINSVLPGMTNTPMMGSLPEEYKKKLPKNLAEPSEIAQVILFLASDRSSYVSGSSYLVDGGVQ